MSQIIKLFDGTALPDIETLTGNSGGAVGPTGGNINVLGTGNITVVGTPGTSTLTLTPTGLASFAWSVITVNQNIAVNNGYICNKAGLLTLTLPTVAAVGTIIRVTGINTAVGWRIAQNANQQIFFGLASSTLGAAGYIEATQIRDSVELVCVVADLSWNVISASGNITVA